MVNKLIHDAAVSITERDIINYSAYPLVRELAYTYGTQVIASTTHATNPKLYLAREDGVCLGYAMFEEENGFGFRSVVASKERGGRRADDRHTWYSKKLASLMRTIKKEKLIPSGYEYVIRNDDKIRGAIVDAGTSYGDTRKSAGLSGEQEHELMEIVLGNRSVHELSAESIIKYKDYLDKFRGIDTIREKRRAEVKDTFSEPLWAVCYDLADSFLVGKLQFNIHINDNEFRGVITDSIDIALPFKRVATLEDIPEIMPKLTMLKVVLQQKDWTTFHKDVIPKGYNGYIEELTVMCRAARSSWDEGILKGDWVIFKE